MSDRRPRVLVIDDERHIRTLLCELLSLWGCEADAAADGGEGLALLGRNRYDLILTDHLMPGLRGLDVVEAVRQNDPQVGIIMLTASPEVDWAPERLGITLLRKPLHIGGLETAVRRALGGGAGMPAAQAGR